MPTLQTLLACLLELVLSISGSLQPPRLRYIHQGCRMAVGGTNFCKRVN